MGMALQLQQAGRQGMLVGAKSAENALLPPCVLPTQQLQGYGATGFITHLIVHKR